MQTSTNSAVKTVKSLFSSIHLQSHQQYYWIWVSFNVSSRHWGLLGVISQESHFKLTWSNVSFGEANLPTISEQKHAIRKWDERLCMACSCSGAETRLWTEAGEQNERSDSSRTAFTDPEGTEQTSDAAAFWEICALDHQSEVQISHIVTNVFTSTAFHLLRCVVVKNEPENCFFFIV